MIQMPDTANRKKGVSREQWILEGLKVLNESGVDHVTIHNLARRLGISRSGFYWHFKNRDELLDALLEDWDRNSTRVITENVRILAMEPAKRLVHLAETVLDYGLANNEIALNHWALNSKRAASQVRSVTRVRLNFVRQAFADLGFRGDALEMRAMLFALNTIWEDIQFSYVSRKRRRTMIRKRVEMLTRRN